MHAKCRKVFWLEEKTLFSQLGYMNVFKLGRCQVVIKRLRTTALKCTLYVVKMSNCLIFISLLQYYYIIFDYEGFLIIFPIRGRFSPCHPLTRPWTHIIILITLKAPSQQYPYSNWELMTSWTRLDSVEYSFTAEKNIINIINYYKWEQVINYYDIACALLTRSVRLFGD